VPDLDKQSVVRLGDAGESFRLQLEDGECLTARRVVIGAGIQPFEHVPPGYDHLSRERESHTGHRSDLRVFADQRVTVVGGEQSL
jgi:FAD-dependent urate hydroxylase